MEVNEDPSVFGKLGILVKERKFMVHSWHQLVPYFRKRKTVYAVDEAHCLQLSG